MRTVSERISYASLKASARYPKLPRHAGPPSGPTGARARYRPPFRVIPCFFGDAHRQLFGVYHPAADAPARRAGVVLCYPGPQEYRQAHWAFRRLAGLLADRGLHVLRFDYFGTGDSAGEASEGRLGQWVADVRTAVRELQDMAGVRRVSLVGLRLGGAIAARAAADGVPAADLVLWDPVVRGVDYLSGLDTEHAAGMRDRTYPEDERTDADEVLGASLTAAARADLAAVDLIAEGCGRPGRVLVVAADGGAEYAELDASLRARGVASELRRVPDATLARGGHWSNDTLMARHVPAAIADFLGGR